MGASLAIALAGFVSPAPALDGSNERKVSAKVSETAKPSIFRDPRAALQAGVESYHAGDATASIEALRYAAEGGESLAQWKLGRIYAEGDGVARDDAKAYDYFSNIVEHFSDDDPDPNQRSMVSSAYVAVGVYLREGVAGAKIAPDPARAFDLFRYAATFFGDAEAQYHLARMYLDGAGVRKDHRQGLHWLDAAARKGHVQAQAALGQLLFNGEAGGQAQRPHGLMYLTLARESASAAAADRWIVDVHARAVGAASAAERKAAAGLLETYLKRRD